MQYTHLGTKAHTRLYSAQCPITGLGVITLENAHVESGKTPWVKISLQGTGYYREYPASGELGTDPPRVSDIAGGYRTITAFLFTWAYATQEQKEDLYEYDKDISFGKFAYRKGGYRYVPRSIRKRAKWTTRKLDSIPRVIQGKEGDMGWVKVYTKDLKAALKGTRSAVRIGHVTVKPAILRQLCKLHGPVVELSVGTGGLLFRSADHRTQCTIKHGAGDPYAGRNGFEARVELAH